MSVVFFKKKHKVLENIKVFARMKDFFLNRQINRIEREANDDFLQILSFGAHCYPTRELHQLLGKLEQESQRFTYYRRLLSVVGCTTALWVAFCFLFQSMNFRLGVYLAWALMPLSLAVFVGGIIYVNRKFSSVRDACLVEKIIVEELERRRKDASIS